MGESMIERRNHERIKTNITIALKQTNFFIPARILNISSTGVFIQASEPQPQDSEISFTLLSPEDLEMVSVSGRVVWSKRSSNSYPAGMGVELTDISDDKREKIRSLLQEHLKLESAQGA